METKSSCLSWISANIYVLYIIYCILAFFDMKYLYFSIKEQQTMELRKGRFLLYFVRKKMNPSDAEKKNGFYMTFKFCNMNTIKRNSKVQYIFFSTKIPLKQINVIANKATKNTKTRLSIKWEKNSHWRSEICREKYKFQVTIKFAVYRRYSKVEKICGVTVIAGIYRKIIHTNKECFFHHQLFSLKSDIMN